jgi:hydrogenase expression/formation protein HypC
MCLAIPGKVEQIFEQNGTRMGKVNFGGIVKDVCLAYLPEIAVGDYTIVHVGFAISRIDEASAQETLKTFHEMGLLEKELDTDASEDQSGDKSKQAAPRGSRPN